MGRRKGDPRGRDRPRDSGDVCVVRIENTGANDAAWRVPFPLVQRGQRHHAAAVLRTERRDVLSSLQPYSPARVLRGSGGGLLSAVYSDHGRAVALVGWADRTL